MLETASCRRSSTVKILTILAVTVCLLTIFSGIGMRQACADETENIAFSVPAKVPFAMKADGTVVGSSASAWRIENKGIRPLRMKDVAASGFDDGSTVSAVSEAMPVAGTSTRGIWTVNVSPGEASLTASIDGIIEIPVGGSTGFAWSANSPDGTKHIVGPAPIALGMVSLTLGGADRVAFAVYSADDGSLNFYKRMDVPEVGDTFEDKIVTKIYTGFETDVYLTDESSSYNGAVNTPWYEERESITAIDIVDGDIKPKSMAFWFQHLSKLQSITGLSKLDTSQTISFQHTFAYTQTLQSVDISGFDTSASRSFDACFTHSGITGIDLSNWNVENSASMGWIFAGCYSLETVKMPCSMTADGLQLRSTFEAATSLQSVDMSGFRPIGLRSVSDIFSGCRNLVEVKGIDGWDTSECTSFDRAFKSCALQALDISGWILPANATSENMLDNMPSIKSVSVGAGFELYRCALPTQSFDGADGKWYSTTTGIGYAPADIPSRKADTYVASKELLPKVAFAVYSEDDGSLDFYKRAFCDMPTAGDAFDGKTVTSVYTGF